MKKVITGITVMLLLSSMAAYAGGGGKKKAKKAARKTECCKPQTCCDDKTNCNSVKLSAVAANTAEGKISEKQNCCVQPASCSGKD